MGSIEHQPLYGTFSVPVWDSEPQSDPATRPYLAPPKPNEVQQRKFPLVNFRSHVFNCPAGGDYSKDAAFMSAHGFTAIKHASRVSTREQFEDPDTMRNVYYAEVRDLVRRVTGCKEVVVTVSVCRGGRPPADLKELNAFKGVGQSKEEVTTAGPRNTLFQPIRLPHCDDAPAGGRQFIRQGMTELREAAQNAGIVAAEDAICTAAGVDARQRDSQPALERAYNDHAAGTLGPRYAGFSIWRPLRTVTRDPLALAPWSAVVAHGDYVAWPYDNRQQGIDGDWTKELAMLKVRPDAARRGDVEEKLRFWYVEAQQPDEVLFVKMFDTAAMGRGATEESGCFHASPDLGAAGYGEDRQSVEVRCYAFW